MSDVSGRMRSMGRPRTGTDLRVKVSIRLDPDTLATIDRAAQKWGWTRTRYIEGLLKEEAPSLDLAASTLKRPTKPVTSDTNCDHHGTTVFNGTFKRCTNCKALIR